MKVKVQIVIESDEATIETETVENIIHIERGTLCPEDLGLTLAEAREMLQKVQQTMVKRQVEQYLAQQAPCPKCGKHRQRKGVHSLVFRTLFGKLRLRSERLFHCACQPHPTRSYSPLAHLLSERTAP